MASVSSSGTDPKDADSAPIVQNGKNPNDQSRLLSTSAPAEHGAAQSDPHHPSEGAIIRQKHKKGRGGSHDEGASNTPSVDGGRDITPHPSVSPDEDQPSHHEENKSTQHMLRHTTVTDDAAPSIKDEAAPSTSQPILPTHVDAIPFWPAASNGDLGVGDDKVTIKPGMVGVEKNSNGRAESTPPGNSTSAGDKNGANLQDPAWAPILDAVPDKNAVLAASAAAAGPPPSVPRRNNQGGTQQESRRSGFRSGEEVTEACRKDPLNVLWNGKPVPNCCKVHIVMQPTGMNRDLRPHLMYELQCEPCGSTVRITRPMHLEDWLKRHRSCSEEIRTMDYKDFSFCKPYLKEVHTAMAKLGTLPSNPPPEPATRAPSRRATGAARRKRTSPGESEGEGRGGGRDTSGDGSDDDGAGPATRAATRQRRIKKPKRLKDYAALVDDGESEGPSDPDSSDERPPTRPSGARGGRPASRGVRAKHEHLDEGMSLLATVAMELDETHDGKMMGGVVPPPPPPVGGVPPLHLPGLAQAGLGGAPPHVADAFVALLRNAGALSNPAAAAPPPLMPAQIPPPLPPQLNMLAATLNNPQLAQLAPQLLAILQQQQQQQQFAQPSQQQQLLAQLHMNMLRQQQQQQQQAVNPIHALLAQLQANRAAAGAPPPPPVVPAPPPASAAPPLPAIQQQLLQALTGAGAVLPGMGGPLAGPLSMPLGSMPPPAPAMMMQPPPHALSAPMQQPALAQQVQALAALLQERQRQQKGGGCGTVGAAGQTPHDAPAAPAAVSSAAQVPPPQEPPVPGAAATGAAATPPPGTLPGVAPAAIPPQQQQQPQEQQQGVALQAANIQDLVQRLLAGMKQPPQQP